jgi:hypothetical protein
MARIVKTQEMKVRKVMLSSWLTTLFFGKKNKTKVEIPTTRFRGTVHPKKGDMFALEQVFHDNGTVEVRMFINGQEVISKPLTRKGTTE